MVDHPSFPQTVNQEHKLQIISQITGLLDEKYVFPEVAQKMISHLEGNLAAGKYLGIPTGLEFAEALTSDLQQISHDHHLRVVFDPEKAEQLQAAQAQRGKENQKQSGIFRKQNYGFNRVERLKGNVGYLDVRHFVDPHLAGETAAAAMRFLAETDAVIVDVRHNGGGNPAMVQFLCSYFFETDRPIHLNSIYSRPKDITWQYWTLPFVPGKHMPAVDLYVLTSSHTFSGGEEFAYNLASLGRATVVGERTAGGANPMNLEPLTHGFFAMVPHGTPTNPVTQSNWEGTGVQPHVEVDQETALEVAHLLALRKLIESTGDPEERRKLAWLAEEVEAHYRPVVVPEAILEKYVGDYAGGAVRMRNGALTYQRRVVRYKALPLSETLFWLEGPETAGESRIEFCLDDDGNVRGLVALFPDGRRLTLPREV